MRMITIKEEMIFKTAEKIFVKMINNIETEDLVLTSEIAERALGWAEVFVETFEAHQETKGPI